MIIKAIYIKNFKGIKELSLQLDDKLNTFAGANATGKSSVIDAVYWCMTGKDANGKEGVEFFPYDQETGEIIHNVQTSVVLILGNSNATNTRFERIMMEKWTKKNGENEARLTGTTTNYTVDNAPVGTQKLFMEYLGKCIDLDTFALTSRPEAFPNLDWKKQREILLEVSKYSDEELFKAHPEFDWLKGKDVELLKGERTANQKAAVTAMKDKAVRIDEISKNIIDGDIANVAKCQAAIKELQKQNAELAAKDKTESTDNGQEIIKSTIRALEAENARAKAEYDIANRDLSQKYENLKSEQQALIRERENGINKARSEHSVLQERVNGLSRELDTMRADFKAMLEMPQQAQDVCPTCGQPLTPEQSIKVFAEVNLDKAKAKEENINRGKKKAADVALAKKQMDVLEASIREMQNSIQTCNSQIFKIDAEKQKTMEAIVPYEQTADGANILAEIASNKARLTNNDVEPVHSQAIADNNSKIDQLMDELSTNNLSVASRTNTEKYRAEQQELAATIGQCEKELSEIADFIRVKCESVSQAVNAKFDGLEFKLFDQQINGGIRDTCEVLMHKTPYRNLSNAEKIITGIKIINVLSDFYGVRNPILIDNRESVVEIPHTESQVINFVVDKNFKELTKWEA